MLVTLPCPRLQSEDEHFREGRAHSLIRVAGTEPMAAFKGAALIEMGGAENRILCCSRN